MYGIIGYPLTHSFSPGYFREKFKTLGIEATYDAFPIGHIEELKELLSTHKALKGLNVTIPYKQSVMGYLDELDATAEAVGAVNCIRIRGGKLKGFNTDTMGFADTLKPLLHKSHSDALILGTGGASKAVAYALKQLGIRYQLVSRTGGDLRYQDIDKALLAGHKLIVNTTPLGMYPDVETAPELPYNQLGPEHLLYDLVYNPAATLFLEKGKAYGAATKNGYDMLIAQAEAGWAIWNSKT